MTMRFALLSAALLLLTSPAMAADADFTAQMLRLNQVDPARNPSYTLGSRATTYRLLDQNRRALGKISDITIGDGGALKSVQAEVIAPGFDDELTFDMAAYDVTPESDAYSVTLTRDQVQDNLSDFLAATESAAGEEGGPVTVQSLIGARVQTRSGSQVGLVDDVVIDDQRKVAVALLLTLMGGNGNRTTVAVPYGSAKIARSGQKANVELSDAQARIVGNYVYRPQR